jgi:glycosyltransferase involved in cell wall biosynthesis
MTELRPASLPPLPTLSLCMIVKNEAENLARCLASVQGVADELIVVDTGSTDQTVEIAESFGAKVFHEAWQNDFSRARNAALAQATSQWILHLDADEALVPETGARVKPLLAVTPADGLKVCVRNFCAERGLLAYFDSMQERLFRNRPDYRYEQPVHELIVNAIVRTGGTVADSDLMIWHYGYQQKAVQGDESRLQRNLQLLEQAVAASPQDPGQCARLGFSYYELGNYPLAYQYLRRALVDLDASHFTTEFMETVLSALWEVTGAMGDSALGAYCVKAMLALSEDRQPSPRVLYTAARSASAEGNRCLQATLAESSVLPEGEAKLLEAKRQFEQASDYYQQLSGCAQVRAEALEKIKADWRACQQQLARIADLLAVIQRQQKAVETLDELLEAADIVEAAASLGSKLTPDLLALVRLKAKAAEAASSPELAEGFAALADIIEPQLHRLAGR